MKPLEPLLRAGARNPQPQAPTVPWLHNAFPQPLATPEVRAAHSYAIAPQLHTQLHLLFPVSLQTSQGAMLGVK